MKTSKYRREARNRLMELIDYLEYIYDDVGIVRVADMSDFAYRTLISNLKERKESHHAMVYHDELGFKRSFKVRLEAINQSGAKVSFNGNTKAEALLKFSGVYVPAEWDVKYYNAKGEEI